MLGRRVAVVVRWPASTRLQTATNRLQLPIISTRRAFSVCQSHRDTATATSTTRKPGRPKQHVGEVSGTVKRAVKKAAKSSTAGEAGKTVAARKKKTTAKKSKAKPKAKAKAKPKPKAKPKKKVLTEKQKTAAAAKEGKDNIASRKLAALNPPKILSNNPYSFFVKSSTQGDKLGSTNVQELRTVFANLAREHSQRWKALSAAEREHWNHEANAVVEKSRAEYKTWVESHSPEQIAAANFARAWLRRHTETGKPKSSMTKWSAIADERQPKRPLPSFIHFTNSRRSSPDFRGITSVETTKLISQEWKALSESEKAKYVKIGQDDSERYNAEYIKIFGHAPIGKGPKLAQPVEA